ncbi:MAG TPA: hypothetical protein VHV08_17780, partial [Pirellulales bacterium]|nr:hypothetical protein [Pirellulales bacterium]
GRTRLRQEQVRPLLPLVTFGYSAGGFGGTGNFLAGIAPFTATYGRTDIDAMAVWTLQNMGAGNLAHANQRRAQLDQTIFDRVRMVNQVRREVTEAYGFSLGERRQVRISLRRLAESEAGFREDYQRFLGFQSLPIEVLNSARLLVSARSSLVEAFIGDNEAQFRLFVAMGQPPYHAAEQLKEQLAPQGNAAQGNAAQGNAPQGNAPQGNAMQANAPQANAPQANAPQP